MKTSRKWLLAAVLFLLNAGLLSVKLEDGSTFAAFGVVIFLGLSVYCLGEVWRYEDRDD